MINERRKVLCVEDELDIRENIAEILRDEGYEVFEADNGKSGFTKFLEINPDLVISDVKMPIADGYELLKNVRENKEVRNSSIPFIFLSALGAKESVIKGVELSANDYLLKPVDFDLLMAKVNEKISNVNRINANHEKTIEKIKKQVSVILPVDIFSYLEVVTQTAKALQDQPYGPFPHRKYLEEISKIYHNSLKIRAVINNSLDGQIIDSKINVNEDLVCIYQIVKDFVDSLNPKISQRIAIIDSQNLPKIKCDPLILLDAIRKTMLGFLKTSNQSKINISFIHDHKNQLVIIFYLDNPSLNSELINYANQINSNEIEQIISVMGCRFEIPDNRANTAVIVIPEYRVIDNFDDN